MLIFNSTSKANKSPIKTEEETSLKNKRRITKVPIIKNEKEIEKALNAQALIMTINAANAAAFPLLPALT